MTLQVRKATKRNAKLRLALCGTAGCGKTYTSLLLATELARGGEILVVDSEHGSSEKYADLFNFDVVELTNFHPKFYIEAIEYAQANGYKVVVLDSLSHAWSGVGGVLELAEQGAIREKGNTFSGWKHATPHQNALIEAILGAKLHVIATMRTKTEYSIESYSDNGRNRQKITKLGAAPIQKGEIEYEFDVVCDMSAEGNTLAVTKTRCSELNGYVTKQPNKELAQILRKWLSAEPNQDELTLADYKMRYEAVTTLDELAGIVNDLKGLKLSPDSWLHKQATDLYKATKQRLELANQQEQPQTELQEAV